VDIIFCRFLTFLWKEVISCMIHILMWLDFYTKEHLVRSVVDAIIGASRPLIPQPVVQYLVGLEMTSMDIISMLQNIKRLIGICGWG
jgi:hypothetical protein